jgi:hypothetical protein
LQKAFLATPFFEVDFQEARYDIVEIKSKEIRRDERAAWALLDPYSNLPYTLIWENN